MDGDIVRCPACGQANRVPAGAESKRVVCGRCKAPLAASDGHPAVLTGATFAEAIAGGDTVVDFWAGWCGPCRMIAPVIEELARERSDVRFAKLNVDENPRTAGSFDVRSIPLLVFFRDGAEVGRVTGAVPKTQIEAAIGRHFGRGR